MLSPCGEYHAGNHSANEKQESELTIDPLPVNPTTNNLMETTDLQIVFPQLFEVMIEAHHGPTRGNNNQDLFQLLSRPFSINNARSHGHGTPPRRNADFFRQEAHLREHTRIAEPLVHTPRVWL